MARKHIVEVFDDIDGSQAAHTIRFAFDGTSYEIDLNDAHAAEFAAAVRPYIDAARPAPPLVGVNTSRSSARQVPHEAGAVRAWARQHGIPINSRGRVPASVLEQWKAAAPPASPALAVTMSQVGT